MAKRKRPQPEPSESDPKAMEVATFLLPLWGNLQWVNFGDQATAAGVAVYRSINLGGVVGPRSVVEKFLADYPDITIMRWEAVGV